MYEPEAFRVTERATLLEVIAARPLGLVVSTGPEGPFADAIPFIARETAGRLVLLAHVARANPLWRRLRERPDTLVVFQAEDAYISPSWYASKAETHKVVPTWNYVMVQARGRAMVHEDPAWLRAQVGAVTTKAEAARPTPWAVEDAPDEFIAAQLRGIVGIEIEVTDLRGKFKLSQNRSTQDRAGVVAGLGEDALAARMRAAEGPDHD